MNRYFKSICLVKENERMNYILFFKNEKNNIKVQSRIKEFIRPGSSHHSIKKRVKLELVEFCIVIKMGT